jgi:F-type H+-transporting ATPase subunit gamma
MTERLTDIQARLENVRQLDAVVTATRGIAAARVQQSRRQLAGIVAYSATISRAIGQAVGLMEPGTPVAHPAPSGTVTILFGAEQGLAGGYNELLLDALGAPARQSPLMIIGSRSANTARERNLDTIWTSRMASQIGAVAEVANRTADALYARLARGMAGRAEVIHARLNNNHKIEVNRSTLFPLDLSRFPADRPAIAPLTTLPIFLLLEQLTGEYIYARLCEAAMQAFAAENQARMDTMSAASNNIGRMLDDIGSREQQVRQEGVTAEIIELAAGVTAAAANKSAVISYKH